MSSLKLGVFHPMLDKVKVGQKLPESSFLCEENLHTILLDPQNISFMLKIRGGWWVCDIPPKLKFSVTTSKFDNKLVHWPIAALLVLLFFYFFRANAMKITVENFVETSF